MLSSWTTIGLVALAACGGRSGAPPELPGVDVMAPAPTEGLEATEAYVAQIVGRQAEFEKVEAPPFEEGDLSRTTVGFRDGAAWVWLTDEWSVGEYGTTLHTYVLRDGQLVFRARAGHAHEPTDDDGSRFVYFEEAVVVGPGSAIVRARRRELARDSSGLTPDFSGAAWAPFAAPAESLDLAEVLARFSGDDG